jgi:hypothetical protein
MPGSGRSTGSRKNVRSSISDSSSSSEVSSEKVAVVVRLRAEVSGRCRKSVGWGCALLVPAREIHPILDIQTLTACLNT